VGAVFVLAAGASCGARTDLDVGPLRFEAPIGSASLVGRDASTPDVAIQAGGDDASVDVAGSDAVPSEASAFDAPLDSTGTPRDCTDVCAPNQSECVGPLMATCIAGLPGCWIWGQPVACVAGRACAMVNGYGECVAMP
jgi:hypothetical protein